MFSLTALVLMEVEGMAKNALNDHAATLAEEVAQYLFGSTFASLTRARKISVADHIWNMGLSFASHAIKDMLGVSHG